MEIFKNTFELKSNTSLILGFFDGIHLAHREVIKSAVDFAKRNNAKSLLITFKESPAEFFKKNVSYIFPREYNYKLIEQLGVDYLLELDFRDFINMSADNFLIWLEEHFSIISISTGFNYTFGANRQGTAEYLIKNQSKYNFKYLCAEEIKINQETVSSTLIRKLLTNGNIEKANQLLDNIFSLKSTVIRGKQLGREIGFPTANLKYPENIIKIPHGVYESKVFNMPAILNWGIKPTVDGKEELLEVHIPNFNENLYEKELEIQILRKIRDEKKFDNIEELKNQIKRDIECLKL